MNYIFLDIDGVITTANKGYQLDLNCVNLITQLINKTNSKVIISSSWKKSTVESTKLALRKQLNLPFIDKIIGITPSLLVYNPNKINDNGCCKTCDAPRGLEIHDYITNYLNALSDNYLIIDDVDDMMYFQKDNFILTDTFVGFTRKDLQKGLKILKTNE